MAVDAGLILIDKDAIAIAGGESCADTALAVRQANPTRILHLIIREAMAKPRTR